MTVGALVLAAGSGRRMGSAGKLTAELHGKPLVAHAVDAVLAAGLPALVVLGDRAADVRAALTERPVTCVTAPGFAKGLSASLRAGIAILPPDWDAVLVVLGDMPFVRPATLAALAAVASDTVVVPAFEGRRGNPVRWPRAQFTALAALTGDTGGKTLLAGLDTVVLPVDDPGILADIDTPAALAAARQGETP